MRLHVNNTPLSLEIGLNPVERRLWSKAAKDRGLELEDFVRLGATALTLGHTRNAIAQAEALIAALSGDIRFEAPEDIPGQLFIGGGQA